jgi:hypothetical protein
MLNFTTVEEARAEAVKQSGETKNKVLFVLRWETGFSVSNHWHSRAIEFSINNKSKELLKTVIR